MYNSMLSLQPSSTKYIGQQFDYYGEPLIWPGFWGFPYKGEKIPDLSSEEEALKKLYIAGDFKNYVFDLSKEEDNKYYNWVMDRIINNLFIDIYHERRWNETTNSMIVYLEWAEIYIRAK